MDKVAVSFIIPCYNSEDTLPDTLQSVMDQELTDWEAIIVSDGSPDNVEAVALEWVKRDARFRYFKKENGGLGSARNYGVRVAQGECILPLDPDNLVRPEFATKAIQILEKHSDVGVVYGDAAFFGEREGIWKVGGLNVQKLLAGNYIDACAVIRRDLFDSLGLFDESIPHQGNEDWEFWLRVIASNHDFYYLEEVTFDYRVTSKSMSYGFNKEMYQENRKHIRTKHARLYAMYYPELYKDYRNATLKIQSIRSSRLVRLYNKLRKLVRLEPL